MKGFSEEEFIRSERDNPNLIETDANQNHLTRIVFCIQLISAYGFARGRILIQQPVKRTSCEFTQRRGAILTISIVDHRGQKAAITISCGRIVLRIEQIDPFGVIAGMSIPHRKHLRNQASFVLACAVLKIHCRIPLILITPTLTWQ